MSTEFMQLLMEKYDYSLLENGLNQVGTELHNLVAEYIGRLNYLGRMLNIAKNRQEISEPKFIIMAQAFSKMHRLLDRIEDSGPKALETVAAQIESYEVFLNELQKKPSWRRFDFERPEKGYMAQKLLGTLTMIATHNHNGRLSQPKDGRDEEYQKKVDSLITRAADLIENGRTWLAYIFVLRAKAIASERLHYRINTGDSGRLSPEEEKLKG